MLSGWLANTGSSATKGVRSLFGFWIGGVAQNPAVEGDSLDKWQPEFPARLDRNPRPFWEGASVYLPLGMEARQALMWDANTEPDLAGYRIYITQARGGPYALLADVGNVTLYTFGMEAGTYYCVVAAYNTSNEESSYSGEVQVIFGPVTITSDMWYPTFPDILNTLKRPFWEGISVIDPEAINITEVVTLDEWAPTYPDRLNAPRRAFWADYSVSPGVSQNISLFMDKWAPTYPNRLNARQRAWTEDVQVEPFTYIPITPIVPSLPEDRILPTLKTSIRLEEVGKGQIFRAVQIITETESALLDYEIVTGTVDEQIPQDFSIGIGNPYVVLIQTDQAISWRLSSSDTLTPIEAGGFVLLYRTEIENLLFTNTSGETATIRIWLSGVEK